MNRCKHGDQPWRLKKVCIDSHWPENALVHHMDLLGKNLQVVFRKTSNIWMTDLKAI